MNEKQPPRWWRWLCRQCGWVMGLSLLGGLIWGGGAQLSWAGGAFLFTFMAGTILMDRDGHYRYYSDPIE